MKKILLLLAILATLTTCQKENIITLRETFDREIPFKLKIPVILPSVYQHQVEEIITLINRDFRLAQYRLGYGNILEVSFPFYDESEYDIKFLADSLSKADDIFAVIGPMKQENIETMADIFQKFNKTMLEPSASNAELLRKYSVSETGINPNEKPFLWSFAGNDIIQSYVTLLKLHNMGKKRIGIIVPDDFRGNTYLMYSPFHAADLGIDVSQIVQYSNGDIADLQKKTMQVLETNPDCLLCVAQSVECAKAVMDAKKQYLNRCQDENKIISLMFTDELIDFANFNDKYYYDLDGLEGIANLPFPNSGFTTSISTSSIKTNSMTAKLYDCFAISYISAIISYYTGITDCDQILKQLLTNNTQESTQLNWTSSAFANTIAETIDNINNKRPNPIYQGALGKIRFDPKVYTTILESCFAYYTIYEGKQVIIDYMSNVPSDNTESIKAAWEYHAKTFETIHNYYKDIEYKPLTNNKAVLICGSYINKNIDNYRHQSDVLRMYQMLKKGGYTDDDIILIIADDIAYSPLNPYQGQVFYTVGGDNLYFDIEVDYKAYALKPQDISNIISSIDSNEGTNVLIYWSGHGFVNNFCWLDSGFFSNELLANTISKMYNPKKFRKMLIITEPCYSGSTLQIIEDNEFEGVLAMSSANQNEFSWAVNYSSELKTYLSDKFTSNVIDSYLANKDISFMEMFNFLKQNTMASHPMILNYQNFGNLSLNYPKEFFCSTPTPKRNP